MTATIDLKHLQKSFGKQQVLKDINLTVNAGEIVGLIGPSGAGKSTVIKTMLGMEKADGGQALILQTTMPNRLVLGKIGYMAQSDALYEDLTARENLAFFGRMKGLNGKKLKDEISHVSQVVDLTSDLDKLVSGFSGGMKRRLSLAISLLGSAQLLILDEPTVGIDPALRRQIWHELGVIRDQGRSILVTTHVMAEAEATDRVALLIGGKIVAFDQPQKLEQSYDVSSIEDVFLKAEKEAQQ
ncbi:ABC transporter ATP-binding protein [Limosilactobacillus sp.]|uniref:ABC transporter ATP-binding protein n=1 Tax=Limosilactobacillus sp. TaxID=2773925 RepID=UPI00345EDDF0